MTLDELNLIKQRWHPDTLTTRPPQDADDVQALVNALESEAAISAARAELLMEIASQPALLYGFRERARALLNAQEVPWEVPTT